jgi:excinuclease ABC subunit C
MVQNILAHTLPYVSCESFNRARLRKFILFEIVTLHLSQKNIRENKFRVCLEYHIGNCLGPCEGKQSEIDYLKNIEEIRSILNGKLKIIRQAMKEQMEVVC